MTNIESIFLNASAGSGKTFALCLRYIALLLSDVRASEILAITFTNAAANEMKKRIIENLSMLYNHHVKDMDFKELDSIHKELERYGVFKDDIKSKIKAVYYDFLRANKRISTIDSFFISILRPFAFYAGIRRDFAIDDRDREGEFIEQFLCSCYDDKNLKKIINYITQDLQISLSSDMFNANLSLSSLINTLYDKAIEFEKLQHSFSDNLKDKIENAAKECNEKETISPYNAKEKIFELSKYLSTYIMDIALENAKGNKNINDLCDKLTRRNLKEILTHTLVKNNKHKHIKDSIKPTPLQEDDIAKLCEDIKAMARLWNLISEREKLDTLSTLIENYKNEMDKAQNKDNKLSFNAIKHKVFNLMDNTLYRGGEFNSDYFYFRLDSKISHILFDEYQDTSIIQYRIFAPLFNEMLAGMGTKDKKTLFFVGDAKQSMYAFRGANPIVFEISKNGLKEEELEYNYRSKANIIDFVNDKFSSIFENYYMQKYHSQDSKGVVSVKVYDKDDFNPYEDETIKQIEDPKTQTLKAAQRRLLKKAASLEIVELLETLIKNGVEQKDIAIIARKRKSLQEFVAIANSMSYDLHFNLDKNGKLIEQPYIKIIYHALLIDSYKEKLKELKQMQERNCGLDIGEVDSINPTCHSERSEESTQYHGKDFSHISQQDILDSIKETLSHKKFSQKTLNKLLNRAYNDDVEIPALFAKTVTQKIKQVIESFRLYNDDSMLLLELASDDPTLQDVKEFFASISHIDSNFIKEEAIQTMTTHASKGLGFKHVVYIDLDDSRAKKADKILYEYDGIYLKHLRLDNSSYIRDSDLESLIKDTESKMEKEEHNILYVALTRAKDGLYIFANKDSYAAKELNLSNTDSKGDIKSYTSSNETKQKKPAIISKLAFQKAAQEEFLQKSDIEYIPSIPMKKKQRIGIISHYSLELMLGYGEKSLLPILISKHGFYIKEAELENIIKRTHNIFNIEEKNGLNFQNAIVKCELPFLQQNAKISRLDAIVKQGDCLFVLEFKTTQNKNATLAEQHNTQLESYKNFIARNKGDSALSVKGYVVYLQDNIVVEEVR